MSFDSSPIHLFPHERSRLVTIFFFLIKQMGSASKCFRLLLSISFVFLLFNFELLDTAFSLTNHEKRKLDDNAGFHIISRFRILLSLKRYRSRPRQHVSCSPAPAPAPARRIISPAPTPTHLFHTHINTQPPLSHRSHITPGWSMEYKRDDGGKATLRGTTIVVLVVAAVSLVSLAVTIVVLLKRSAKYRKSCLRPLKLISHGSSNRRSPTASRKVSSHPSPELLYLSSSVPYPENDSGIKPTSESKSMSPIESMLSSPSKSGELIKSEHTVSCLGEENLCCEDPNSDENESFHSISCSDSSNGSFADFSLQIFDPKAINQSPSSPHTDNSPSNSSYKSLSPICRSHFFSTPGSMPPKWPTTISCTNFSLHKTSYSSPKRLDLKCFQVPHTENNQERQSLTSKNQERQPNVSSVPMVPHPASTGISANFQRPTLELCSPDNTESSPSKAKPTPSPSNVELFSSSTPKETSRALIEPENWSLSINDRHEKPPRITMDSTINAPKPPPPLPPPYRSATDHKGHNSGQPPPPPPPLPLQIQVGKDGSPLPRLKPLHWDKVRAAPNRSMVWDDIRSSSFEFEVDEQTIESLFAYNFQSSAKNEEAKSKTLSTSKHVIEHKRLQNITILLKTLNATTEQVCNSIIEGTGLSVQQLEALVKMKPTKEEEEKLFNYGGEVDSLDPAEKFVKVVLGVPMAFSRMEVMLYRENFEDEVAHLRTSFGMINGACRELKTSKLFLRLLEAVLKTGNRMNVGTIRGGARAFKLDTLLKLADVRGADGKTTLLHFVVQEMVRSNGLNTSEKAIKTPRNIQSTAMEREDYWAMGVDLLSELNTELGNVKKAASIDLETLINSISNLSCGIAQLRNLIEKDLSTDEKNKSFSQCMKSFLSPAEKTMTELKDNEGQVLLHVREIIEYYHGDVGKDECNLLHIFVIVKDFLCLLDRVCREQRRSKNKQATNLVLPFR